MALLKKLGCLLAIALFFFAGGAKADDSCSSLSGQSKIDCYTKKISETKSQEKTLSSQINLINNQISLTQSQISVTEDKLDRLADSISTVSGKINNLEVTVVKVSNILASRITRTYVEGRADPFLYLLSASDFQDFWQRFEYMRIIQKHDKQILVQMAASRKNYNDQKTLLQEKERQQQILSAQLKSQKAQLDKQNVEKQALLNVTRNDEARFQQMLADAQRELDAIRASQFTGKRDVKKGEVIGLMGNTGYSFGAHLHFGVYNLSESDADRFDYPSNTDSPFNYLTGRGVTYANDACYNTPGTVGTGGWDWPMNDIIITQCYGRTPVSPYLYIGGIHHGVDMSKSGGDISIRAVEDGVAYSYRGSSSLGNNVRVFHKNGKMTLYLHLQ